MDRRWLLIAGLLPGALIGSVALAAGDPYLGMRHTVVDDPPGLEVSVVAGAPAAVAGLQSGDIIIELDRIVLADTERPYAELLTEAIAAREIGDILPLVIYRAEPKLVLTLEGRQVASDAPLLDFPDLVETAELEELVAITARRSEQIIPIDVVLGVRPDTLGEPFGDNSLFNCRVPDASPQLREFLNQLVEQQNISLDTENLFARLDRRASPDDGYKTERLVYLLRDGLKGEAVVRDFSGGVAADIVHGPSNFHSVLDQAADLIDAAPDVLIPPVPLETGLGAEQHLDIIELLINTAAVKLREAFADFSAEELEFIADNRAGLTEVFRKGHYIQEEDEDPRRVKANLQLVELGQRIDYISLLEAQAVLAPLADESYLAGLKADLLQEFAGASGEDLLVRETALGNLVISGTGHSWRTGDAPALLIDLGGYDFYTWSGGAGSGLEQPVSVVLELGGSDAYESTTHYSQGSGSLGVGMLVDAEGDDQYVGLQWAQGTGFFGCGALLDLAGDDVYRGHEFCQGAAIFGSGLLIDFAGNDRMEGMMKCQAFGGAKGVGLVIDVAGDDYRYCKGKYQTGYGDPGIFDSWGQGCSQGFRGYASGGVAGIIDLAGTDYNEAGNFSQGGGYYFGLGFFHDRGWENDTYIGSRYNQGFCAHQAVGVFLEEGGDDFYLTRQAVAQGLAWDECATMFIDYGGDDEYHGGGGFSQGASAHNALCVMWDRGGRDTYNYAPGQARAGGNDYHGGTSLSLFIDEGGDEDWYNSDKSANDLITGWPEHGFFADLPGGLDAYLITDAWHELWIDPLQE